MSELAAAPAAERRLLRRLAGHPALPAAARRLAARLEASDVGRRLAHGALWSVAGAAASRALALVASVVTARILGEEGYGELGVIASTLLTFQAFSTLGLGLTATKYVAELRARDPARAGRVLALSAVASAATGLLAAAALWGLAPWLAAGTLGAPQLAGALRIASVALLFTTLAAAQAGALAGFEAFRTTTWLNAGAGALGVVASVVGVWGWGLAGAVWALAVTSAAQWALGHLAVRAHARRHGVPVGVAGWWREQRVLWTFALPALAQGLMVTPVTWAAGAILVNRPGGYAEMGALSATNHWYAAVLFLPGALGAALLPVLSERVGAGDARGARGVLRSAIGVNLAAVAPLVACGALASPSIMGLYGPGFAGEWPALVAALATAGLVAVTNPVGSVLAASGRLWLGFAMNAGWAAVFLGATALLVPWGAAGVATARLVAYAVHAVWTFAFAAAFLRSGAGSGAVRPGGA